MGCDIHMWVERLEDDNKWHLVPDARVYGGRNYVLFGWLAGVRGYGPPIADSRGFPEDMSPELQRVIIEGSNDHRLATPGDQTPSWFTVAEIVAAFEQLPRGVRCNDYGWRPDVYSQQSMYSFVYDYCDYWQSLAQGDATRIRIVFNFDS